MKIIFILLYVACITRTLQVALAHNYRKALGCAFATCLLYLISNGYILRDLLMYKDSAGDYAFNITFRVCVVIMTFVISFSFWYEFRESFKK